LDFFLRGGYPQPVLNPSQDYYLDWMENYFQTYINRDIRKLYPKLDSLKYRRFISILSELSGTIINKAQVGRSLDISEVTVRDYLEIADKTFIWRMIPSYEKTKIKSVTKMPKGIMRDSGLLHYLSQTDTREKLLRSPNYGQNFESFITEELIRGMQATIKGRWDYYYYRTKNGIEVDLLLEGRFGLLPIEIKAGSSTSIKDVKSLTYFLETMNLPLGMVINNDTEIKMLSQRIIQIPACCL
jgi:predicted AAA+ superfamily ATPase